MYLSCSNPLKGKCCCDRRVAGHIQVEKVSSRVGSFSSDRDWLEHLWHEYGDRIFAFAARRVGHSYAEEVVAEVFLVAWRSRGERPGSELPWLYGVARKVVSQHYRTQSRWERLVKRIEQEQHQSASPRRTPDTMDVLGALAQLSDSDREAVLLIAWEGLDPREAALVIGITGSAFRMRLSRARRRLRRLLAQENTNPTPTYRESS